MLREVNDVLADYGLIIDGERVNHAPYKDERTAEYEALISDLESEVERLEDEIKALKKADRNNVNRSDSNASSDAKPKVSEVQSEGKAQVLGEFNTSYYGADCVGCTGTTASGLTLSSGQTHYNGDRIVAADTSIIPLHSRIKVTNPNGESYTAIVKDRGGAIKGRKLDVLVGSEAESVRHGRHGAMVEIIEYGDNKYRRE